MKKLIFLFTLLFTLLSYSQSDKLIGEWTNCSSICNGVTASRNVCSKIEFKSNQTVIITQPSKVENLNWKIAGNEITFISLDEDPKNVTFSNSKIYILKFNETFTVLTVNEKGKEECYDLLLR
ncbi:MAG TPA: hypothetical protein VFS71_18995 [Flavobacterium sp.]|uniref:hypothetical protein n=1 Tax=Flavobacterium sp. TaxID=239 RepID=UPI002DB74AFD|nr:hypothetical protein [Flavobacterium sp.]HEU4791780.1 hypothetical protein [Flavobacterium sp.]